MCKSTEFDRLTIGNLKVGRIVLNLFGWSTKYELLKRCQNKDFFKTLSMTSILYRSNDSTNYFGVLSAPYWPSIIISQPAPPCTDLVPPSTDQYRPILTQYHQVLTSTVFYFPQYQPVPTSTALSCPSTIIYQPVLPSAIIRSHLSVKRCFKFYAKTSCISNIVVWVWRFVLPSRAL